MLNGYIISYLDTSDAPDTVNSVFIEAYSECRTVDDFNSWKAAISGNPEEQNMVGMRLSLHQPIKIYTDLGIFPPRINFSAAKFWFSKSAEHGAFNAMNNLSVMYENGYGVEHNLEKAFEYYKNASNGRSPVTIGHLEDCYRHGKGCDLDTEKTDYYAELKSLLESEESTQ